MSDDTTTEGKLHACDPNLDHDGYDGCPFSCCATGPCKCPDDVPVDERCSRYCEAYADGSTCTLARGHGGDFHEEWSSQLLARWKVAS